MNSLYKVSMLAIVLGAISCGKKNDNNKDKNEAKVEVTDLNYEQMNLIHNGNLNLINGNYDLVVKGQFSKDCARSNDLIKITFAGKLITSMPYSISSNPKCSFSLNSIKLISKENYEIIYQTDDQFSILIDPFNKQQKWGVLINTNNEKKDQVIKVNIVGNESSFKISLTEPINVDGVENYTEDNININSTLKNNLLPKISNIEKENKFLFNTDLSAVLNEKSEYNYSGQIEIKDISSDKNLKYLFIEDISSDNKVLIEKAKENIANAKLIDKNIKFTIQQIVETYKLPKVPTVKTNNELEHSVLLDKLSSIKLVIIENDKDFNVIKFN